MEERSEVKEIPMAPKTFKILARNAGCEYFSWFSFLRIVLFTALLPHS